MRWYLLAMHLNYQETEVVLKPVSTSSLSKIPWNF